MPEHAIEMESPPRVVLNSDVVFHVRSDERLLGHLQISKGAVEWRPAYHTVNVNTIGWERFAAIMEAEREGRLSFL